MTNSALGVSTSEVVASNLNAMHATRKQFIKYESLKKLRRALCHQVRTSITQSYKNGDVVFYKRNLCDRWLDPGTVIIKFTPKYLTKANTGYLQSGFILIIIIIIIMSCGQHGYP